MKFVGFQCLRTPTFLAGRLPRIQMERVPPRPNNRKLEIETLDYAKLASRNKRFQMYLRLPYRDPHSIHCKDKYRSSFS